MNSNMYPTDKYKNNRKDLFKYRLNNGLSADLVGLGYKNNLKRNSRSVLDLSGGNIKKDQNNNQKIVSINDVSIHNYNRQSPKKYASHNFEYSNIQQSRSINHNISLKKKNGRRNLLTRSQSASHSKVSFGYNNNHSIIVMKKNNSKRIVSSKFSVNKSKLGYGNKFSNFSTNSKNTIHYRNNSNRNSNRYNLLNYGSNSNINNRDFVNPSARQKIIAERINKILNRNYQVVPRQIDNSSKANNKNSLVIRRNFSLIHNPTNTSDKYNIVSFNSQDKEVKLIFKKPIIGSPNLFKRSRAEVMNSMQESSDRFPKKRIFQPSLNYNDSYNKLNILPRINSNNKFSKEGESSTNTSNQNPILQYSNNSSNSNNSNKILTSNMKNSNSVKPKILHSRSNSSTSFNKNNSSMEDNHVITPRSKVQRRLNFQARLHNKNSQFSHRNNSTIETSHRRELTIKVPNRAPLQKSSRVKSQNLSLENVRTIGSANKRIKINFNSSNNRSRVNTNSSNKNSNNIINFMKVKYLSVSKHAVLWESIFKMQLNFENKSTTELYLNKILSYIEEEMIIKDYNFELFNLLILSKAYKKYIKSIFILLVFIKFSIQFFNIEESIMGTLKTLLKGLNDVLLQIIQFFIFNKEDSNNKKLFSSEFSTIYAKLLIINKINKSAVPNTAFITELHKSLDSTIKRIKSFSMTNYNDGQLQFVHTVTTDLLKHIDIIKPQNMASIIYSSILYYLIKGDVYDSSFKNSKNIDRVDSVFISSNPVVQNEQTVTVNLNNYGLGTNTQDKAEEPFLPDIRQNGYTLVLDLDETLVHFFSTQFGGIFLIRPGCQTFLEEMSKFCDIVIFTAATKEYADAILDVLDNKHKFIKNRLYREHVSLLDVGFVKDLSKLGRDLKKVIMIDNKSDNFRLQYSNGIAIKSWIYDMFDSELYYMGIILMELFNRKPKDVRPFINAINEELENNKGNDSPFQNVNFSTIFKNIKS